MKIGFRVKILFFALFITIIPLVFISLFNYNKSSLALSEQVEQELSSEMKVLKKLTTEIYNLNIAKLNNDLGMLELILKQKGMVHLSPKAEVQRAINQVSKEKKNINIKSIKYGNYEVLNNNSVVDEFKENYKVSATIFQKIDGGLLRISTNIFALDGKRAVGTFIPENSPVYKTIMTKEIFIGNAFVVDRYFISIYKPILNQNNEVIGAIYVGRDLELEMRPMLSYIENEKVASSGYFFILNSKGILINHPTSKGKDLSGKAHIDEIIENKNGIIKYTQTTKGSTSNKEKMVAYTYVEPLDWYICGGSALDDFFHKIINLRNISLIALFIIVTIIIIILLPIIENQLIRPLLNLKNAFEEMQKNNFVYELSDKDINRTDEIGLIFHSYLATQNRFKELFKLLNNESQKVKHSSLQIKNISAELESSSAEMTIDLDEMAKSQNQVKDGSNSIAAASEQASVNVSEIAQSAVELSDGVKNVANLADDGVDGLGRLVSQIHAVNDKIIEIKSNINALSSDSNTTASAIEEMSASINEISKNTQLANEVSQEANERTNQIKGDVSSLTDGAKNIGQVVKVINEIADQTNLLALNATIEAASAGDAGKGFAVVASEVKALAKQTASSTDLIESEIKSVQEIVKKFEVSINLFSEVMDKLLSINNTIASAVEEQSITVNEITHTIASVANEATSVDNYVNEIERYSSTVSEEANSVSDMIKNIAIVTSEVAFSSETIARNSDESSYGVKEIAKNTEIIDNEIVQVVSQIESVSESANQNSDLAQKAFEEVELLDQLASNLDSKIKEFKYE